jgi:hypothetical protein
MTTTSACVPPRTSLRMYLVRLLRQSLNRCRTDGGTSGRIGAFFVPGEMSAAYAAFLLALIFGGKWRTRPAVWGVFAFCVTYTLFYVYAAPQLGTLYRMRAFAFAIIVCTALAVVLANKAGIGEDVSA